jgi:hypothetical protein
MGEWQMARESDGMETVRGQQRFMELTGKPDPGFV